MTLLLFIWQQKVVNNLMEHPVLMLPSHHCRPHNPLALDGSRVPGTVAQPAQDGPRIHRDRTQPQRRRRGHIPEELPPLRQVCHNTTTQSRKGNLDIFIAY